jgi:protein-tyrosine phosphatase
MVDIHCHILYGLDDGARTLEDSLAMAEDAIADGITHVVGTPHSSSDHKFDYAQVKKVRNELRANLGERLIIASGCDFHLNPENLQAIRQKSDKFCINQKDYLLVEFSEFSIPPSMNHTLHELHLQGLRPIVTHPERNGILRTQPDRLRDWVHQGCFVQVTAGSLAGVFGPGAKERAWTWIEQGLVHFVSSDAHNTTRRPLKLKFAYEAIAELHGEEKAQALLIDNPLAAFEGRPLPYVPEVISELKIEKRKRFFFF